MDEPLTIGGIIFHWAVGLVTQCVTFATELFMRFYEYFQMAGVFTFFFSLAVSVAYILRPWLAEVRPGSSDTAKKAPEQATGKYKRGDGNS